MPAVFDYVGVISLLAEEDVPADIKDEWQNTLKGEQSRIYSHLTEKIPNAAIFADKIADASSDAWESFVNPDWPTKDFVTVKQRVKLARAYPAWSAGVEAAFAEGGYFPNRVDSKASKFLLARYTMSVVGVQNDPTIMWRAGTKAVKCFVGDTRISRYIDPTLDSLTGTPTMCIISAVGKFFQPLTLGKLVQGYIMAKFADEGGLSATRDSIITAVNSDLDTILSAVIDTTVAQAPPASYLHLAYSAGEFSIQAHAEAPAG